jgi:DNA-binding XRE family transcriptional regulator
VETLNAMSHVDCSVDGTVEEWRSIRGYEMLYEVSNIGRVRRTATGRILRPGIDRRGYQRVALCLRGKQTSRQVSHLVADAFLPAKCPTDTVVRHLNDNKLDNRVANLARGTQKDNVADSMRNGTFVRGILHGQAKLTDDIVREIRRLYATGNFTQVELARRFGVSQRTINDVVRQQLWRHVL